MSWNQQVVVDSYADAADNTSKTWYEDEVNAPSILALLPKERVRLLDFGCGPGNFTSRLARHFDVMGADSSGRMVRKAQDRYPGIRFFEWDARSGLPSGQKAFQAIVTKLTLEFVADLSSVAQHLHAALEPHGLLVISVQHPLLAISMHPEDTIPYWGSPKFDVQIGTTGTVITKIHRNLDEYTAPFLTCGFSMEKITEPQIPDDIATAHAARPIDRQFPKRLNMLLRKS